MISIVLFDTKEKELNKVEDYVHEIISRLTSDESRVVAECEPEELFEQIRDVDLCDVMISEYSGNNEVLMELRRKYPNTPLLLLVDATVSPMEYVKPDIMPSAIVIRPSEDAVTKQTVNDLLSRCIKHEEEDEQVIKIETREGVLRIPFSQVYYFESKAKKVYIRLKREEYGYYDTLDHLEETLPDYFVRCHRGLIANMNHAVRYSGVEKVLYLQSGIDIPVSRRYSAAVRERMKG